MYMSEEGPDIYSIGDKEPKRREPGDLSGADREELRQKIHEVTADVREGLPQSGEAEGRKKFFHNLQEMRRQAGIEPLTEEEYASMTPEEVVTLWEEAQKKFFEGLKK